MREMRIPFLLAYDKLIFAAMRESRRQERHCGKMFVKIEEIFDYLIINGLRNYFYGKVVILWFFVNIPETW